MRAWLKTGLAATIVLSAAPAVAQDAEALRRELEDMRRQFETMKQGYEKAINDLSGRIQKLESSPPPAAAPAPAAPAAAVSQIPPSGAPGASTLSPMDIIRPRQPFSLYERRGPGQLLFDIGIAGDFVGNFTQDNVEKAMGGTFAGRENRFFPREVELSLFGQIDPYARGEVRIEGGEEDRGGDIAITLAEANLTLMTLPFNTQAKLGQMRNRFGLLNQLHAHDLPFIDEPNVYTRFFGEEGLVERGAEFTWVPPLPFYVELLGGVFNGDNDVAFGRRSLKYPLVTGRVRTFLELGDWGAVQLGMSVASGLTEERLRNTILGWDLKYKYVPEGWQHALFTLGGEALYQMRRVNQASEDIVSETVTDEGDVITTTFHTPDEKRTRNRLGWYVWGELQPVRFGFFSQFIGGFRYDWTEYPTDPGHEWSAEPYLSFLPSEFLRFRIGYKHTERSNRWVNVNGGSARSVDEILFQSTFILGAHPAHPF